MGTFPLPIFPDAPWRNVKNSPYARNAHFGASRTGFPVHGACDLLAPAGTNVLAVEDGTIIRHYDFVTYESRDKKTNEVTCRSTTWAIDVQHDSFIARYSEIAPNLPNGLRAGSVVSEGQVIATVGSQCGGSMLHFEMFQDRTRVREYLTNKSHDTRYRNVPQANYERRDDLMDPTPFLDVWWHEVCAKRHQVDLGDLEWL